MNINDTCYEILINHDENLIQLFQVFETSCMNMNLRTFAVESCCIIFLNTAAEWLALRLGPRCIESPWPGPTAQIQDLIARMKEFKPGCRLKLWVSKLTDPKWLPINMVYNVWSMMVEKWRYIPFTLPIQRKLPKKKFPKVGTWCLFHAKDTE